MASIRFCEVCKQEIDADRAQAHPQTRLCGVHSEAIKKYGGEFIRSAQQERTSKQGSLKINYGGIEEIISTRNQRAIDQLRDDYLLSK